LPQTGLWWGHVVLGRPRYLETKRRAEIAFVVLHEGPLAADVVLDHARFGHVSPEALQLLRSTEMNEESQPAFFSALRGGIARALAEADLGPLARRLDEAHFATTVTAELEDPKDLSALQTAWACVGWLVARGATLVEDLLGSRWFPAEAFQGPPTELDVRREVRLVFDEDQAITDPVSGRKGRLLNTRGMRKFARPDVVAVVTERMLSFTEPLVLSLAQAMADGWMPAEPRHGIELATGGTLYLHPEDSPEVKNLHLYNDAVVLRTEKGEHLAFGYPGGATMTT
jgi:hypothetical protein